MRPVSASAARSPKLHRPISNVMLCSFPPARASVTCLPKVSIRRTGCERKPRRERDASAAPGERRAGPEGGGCGARGVGRASSLAAVAGATPRLHAGRARVRRCAAPCPPDPFVRARLAGSFRAERRASCLIPRLRAGRARVRPARACCRRRRSPARGGMQRWFWCPLRARAALSSRAAGRTEPARGLAWLDHVGLRRASRDGETPPAPVTSPRAILLPLPSVAWHATGFTDAGCRGACPLHAPACALKADAKKGGP